ncbi:MAG TPA: hydroxymethylbilane synthase [Syntrophales bacterium]|nr:hydroxymethylbilane synthase [Syntrophales bacterium]
MRIGTRGSALALRQAVIVAENLKGNRPDLEIETIVIKTTGDRMQDIALSRIGGKGVFVKEIEEALLRGEIDVAVHSLKDVPSEIPGGLEIGAVPLREDPRDVLISRNGEKISELRRGARIGTGSLRRGIQIRHWFPHIEIVPIRGNLDTRIRKLRTENLDAIVVAAAGLSRLGLAGSVTQYLPVESVVPAIGQGALAVEMRSGDGRTRELTACLNHPPSFAAAEAERAFLKVFGGGCQLPIAAHAEITGDMLEMGGLIGNLDGTRIIRDSSAGHAVDAGKIGKELAVRILKSGGDIILAEVKTEI